MFQVSFLQQILTPVESQDEMEKRLNISAEDQVRTLLAHELAAKYSDEFNDQGKGRGERQSDLHKDEDEQNSRALYDVKLEDYQD